MEHRYTHLVVYVSKDGTETAQRFRSQRDMEHFWMYLTRENDVTRMTCYSLKHLVERVK